MKTKKMMIIITTAIILAGLSPIAAKAEWNSEIVIENDTEATEEIVTEEETATEEVAIEETATEEETTEETATEEETIEEETTGEVAIEEETTEETAIEEETTEETATEEETIDEVVIEEVATETITYQAVRMDNVNLSNDGWEYAIAYVTDVLTGETQKVNMQNINGNSLYGNLTNGTVASDREYTLTVWNFYQNDEVTVINGNMTFDTTDVTAMNFIAA